MAASIEIPSGITEQLQTDPQNGNDEKLLTNDSSKTDVETKGKESKTSGLYPYDLFIWAKNKVFPSYLKAECRTLIRLGWGLSFNSFLVFFIPISMLFVVGHLGKEILAAVGLAISFCNLTGMVFGVGFITACDTLCSQAYGAGNYRKIGIVAQRALLISVVAVFPIIAVWINAEKILIALGQKPIVARLAGQFIDCYIPALFLFIAFNIMIRYLACQGIVYPSVYAVLFATVVNGVCCYLFIYYFQLGVRGGAFAVDVAYLSLCLFMLLFICFRLPRSATWQGWSWQCLVEWKEFLFLGIPSMAMISLEWWCFEIGIIALGIIGATEQATQIILYHVAEIVYFIAYGLSMATAVRIGHLLGSGKPVQAKRSMKAAIVVINVITILMGILILVLKDVIGYLFTKDRSVLIETSKTVAIIGLVEVLDGLMTVLNGGIRGAGLQKRGALINFIGYVCIACPCLLVLMFVARKGVIGFWTGIIIGLTFQVISFSVLLFRSDWDKLSRKAKKRGGVFQEAISFDVDKDQVNIEDNAVNGIVTTADTTDADGSESLSSSLKHEIDDADEENAENVQTSETFFAIKIEKPATSIIITKLAIAAVSLAILISSIFMRIYI